MARKYARDNRGRFASKGAGATARGSRLKTAGGNKRDGQTIQAKGGPKSTIGKPKGLKPGAIKSKGDDVAKRREANSIRKGNRVAVTDADRRNRAQSLATAERRLAEMERTGRGRNSLTGSDMMLKGQRAQVEALRQPLPSSRKAQRAEQVVANRDALARKRSERKNGRIVSEFRARAPAAAKPAATTGRRKPLKGVGATLAKNLSGFKGLPVSVRSRKQAAAYQGARRRSMLSYNAVSTGGTFKRGVNRQPNLLTGGVDRVGAGKFRPVYKKKRG